MVSEAAIDQQTTFKSTEASRNRKKSMYPWYKYMHKIILITTSFKVFEKKKTKKKQNKKKKKKKKKKLQYKSWWLKCKMYMAYFEAFHF